MNEVKKSLIDPTLPIFATADLVAVSGLSRGAVDMWVNRGLLEPTQRRERMSPSRKSSRPRKGQGKPMFSMAAIFRARLAHDLGTHFGVGLSEWMELAKIIEVTENFRGRGKGPLAGSWMEAVARGIETNTPITVLAYAKRGRDGNWVLSMQLSQKLDEPKLGGGPQIFIPMSEIFTAVYHECKKLLGRE
jgi:hypothetical protein